MSNTGYRRCCGIDVHKKVVAVHVLPPDGAAGEDKYREFRTFRRDLDRMRQWLVQCKVTAVVMESTGQYWRPVWEALEGWMEELLPIYGLCVTQERFGIEHLSDMPTTRSSGSIPGRRRTGT
jgi:hypothetical protein